MNCSPPGSSVHEIFQVRILEWVAIAIFKGSYQPRDRTRVSCTAARFSTDWATREVSPLFKSDNEIDKLKWTLWKPRLTESQQTRSHLKDGHQILLSFYFPNKKYLPSLVWTFSLPSKSQHREGVPQDPSVLIILCLDLSLLKPFRIFTSPRAFKGFPVGAVVTNLVASARDAWDKALLPGLEDLLRKGMATHSSVLAWRIPWTEEPGRLQFIGSQRVGHDWSDLAPMHTGLLNLTSFKL